MDKQKITKEHKFPHLQREIDVLLEGFDHVEYTSGTVSVDKVELSQINVDDVMSGRSEERMVLRPRHSIVKKARLQEKKYQDLQRSMLNQIPMITHDNVLLARRNNKEVAHTTPKTTRISRGPKRASLFLKIVKIVWKYIKF